MQNEAMSTMNIKPDDKETKMTNQQAKHELNTMGALEMGHDGDTSHVDGNLSIAQLFHNAPSKYEKGNETYFAIETISR